MHEVIHVGPQITITVVRVGRITVQIGIDAPPKFNIWRDEIEAKPAEAEQNKEDAA